MSLGETADPRACYVFQKQFLQHLQWNLPPRRWVVKVCAHQFQLKELFAEFPDAVCIWPHRDPVEVHQSTLAISSVLYHAITNGNMDWKQFAAGSSDTRPASTRSADPLVDIANRAPAVQGSRQGSARHDKGIYSRFDFPVRWNSSRACAAGSTIRHRPDRYGLPYSLKPFGLEARKSRRCSPITARDLVLLEGVGDGKLDGKIALSPEPDRAWARHRAAPPTKAPRCC
jgi:hypothetical protein